MIILSEIGTIKGIVKLSTLGVADKLLKISAFFVPLHLLLAFFDSNQHANFKLDSNTSLALAYIFGAVTILFTLRWTAHAIKEATDFKIKKQVTFRLNEMGLINHTTTPNSSSNAIVSYLEYRSLFIIYCLIASIVSLIITGEEMLTLIPLATLGGSLWLRTICNRHRFGFYCFAATLNLALVAFMYGLLLHYSQNTNHEQLLLLLLFVIFIFRFAVDAAMTLYKKTLQVQKIKESQ